MKIIITGSTGFLGKSFFSVLGHQHELIGLSREDSSGIKADITQPIPPLPTSDMVVHCAGMAHVVRNTTQENQEFFRVNLNGTQNLLSALEVSLPNTLVFISSVAVYGLCEGNNIREDAPLAGQTPYALSKILAERACQNWALKHKVNLVILRLPLLTGINPPGNLNTLYNAIRRGIYFRIGSGNARKSMVGVNDIAKLIPSLLGKSGIYNLSDGVHSAVNEIENHIAFSLGKSVRSIPPSLIYLAAKIGDRISTFPINTIRLKKLENSLTFDDTKARIDLGWLPSPALPFLTFS